MTPLTWTALVVALVAVAVARRVRRRAGRFLHAPQPSHLPVGRVSAVVPARDEADHLAVTLDGLLAQEPPLHRVVIVDDASSDGTGRIADRYAARHASVEALHLSGPPPGWAGKVHAMARGAQRADGDWLLFSDADVRHHPGAVGAMRALAEARSLDLVSSAAVPTKPWLPWSLVTPATFELILCVAAPDGAGHGRALAVGHFMLVRRSVYERIGGYAALRGTTVDDVDFATRARDHGARTAMAWSDGWLTSDQLRSWGALWRSWRKSLAGGTDLPGLALVVGGAMIAMGGALPWLLALRFAVEGRVLGLALAVLALTAQVWARAPIDRRLHLPLGFTLSAGLGWIPLGGILIDAGLRAAFGRGPAWKGRTAP